jgi:hypothetical protein
MTDAEYAELLRKLREQNHQSETRPK